MGTEEQINAEEAQADAYFDEFAGDASAESQEDESFDRPRDEQGRFAEAAGGDDDELGDEDLPEATEQQGEAVGDDKAPPELSELDKAKQEAQNWQHRYQSDLGRQSALQRKVQELEQENQRLRQSGGKQSGDNPEGSGYSDEQWEAMKEDFPEVAQAIEARFAAMESQYQQQYQKLQGQVEPIQQQAHEQFIQSQYSILEQQHPDWRDTVAKPEFNQWLQRQPSTVQQMMGSENAAEAAYLLDNFKLSTGAAEQSNANLQQRRKRQLEQSQTVPRRSGRQRSTIPDDDPDALFDYFADRA